MNMTNQEAFDLVATKLIEQGRPSMAQDGPCMYHGPNNTRCAAGWLIPDDKYHIGMEGISISCDYNEIISCAIPCDLDLAMRLQEAHDGVDDVMSTNEWRLKWKQAMYSIASDFCLHNALLLTEWQTNVAS